MHIYPVFEVSYRNFSAVTDNAGQYSDDMPVCDAVFSAAAIITADNVVIFSDFKNTMQNILTAVTFIQRHIIPFQFALGFGNDKNISALFDEWHHAVTNVCIYDFA